MNCSHLLIKAADPIVMLSEHSVLNELLLLPFVYSNN